MTENIVLEQVIDLVDNHYYTQPATTEANIVENVAELIGEVTTLTTEKEDLLETIADFEENL